MNKMSFGTAVVGLSLVLSGATSVWGQTGDSPRTGNADMDNVTSPDNGDFDLGWLGLVGLLGLGGLVRKERMDRGTSHSR